MGKLTLEIANSRGRKPVLRDIKKCQALLSSLIHELNASDGKTELKKADAILWQVLEDNKDVPVKLIGYQVEDVKGDHEMHPDMDASFCVYSRKQCEKMIGSETDKWTLIPIYNNTIENPTLMF